MIDMEDDYAIGLNIGSKFSSIGVYRNGEVEIIPNSFGEKLTPSVVKFQNDKIFVGEDADDFLIEDCDTCIYDVKRFIGLDPHDMSQEKFQTEIKCLPFNIIINNKKDNVFIEVRNKKGEKKLYSPIEITSLIIKKLVHNAENYLNHGIKKIVISVPAYFNDSQRKGIIQAAELSGLNVIKIISEPVAATFAYEYSNQKLGDKILVFDLGGKTFDLSILSDSDNKDNDQNFRQIISYVGDSFLGGEDFDNALVDYILHKTNISKNVKNNSKALKTLKDSCNNAKKILSVSNETNLMINDFYNHVDIWEKITRDDFVKICEPFFSKIMELIREVLTRARINKSDIKDVILIGGSSRIPKIKNLIEYFFCKEINIHDFIDPDETITHGATLIAQKYLYGSPDISKDISIFDFLPFSLGISVANQNNDNEINIEGDEMNVIIKRGSHIPIENCQYFYTTYDNQTTFPINIYEGNKKYVKYNRLIYKCELNGLSPKPKGKTKIKVQFKIDINGIIYVTAVEESEKKGQYIGIVIKNDGVIISDEEKEKISIKYEHLNKIFKNEKFEFNIDNKNIKELLRKLKESYKLLDKHRNYDDEDEGEDEDKRILILQSYNEFLELYIDSFDKYFDNENILEKHYIYIKELFLSYIETLKINSDKSVKTQIFKTFEKYLHLFIIKPNGYLNNLLDTIYNGIQKKLKWDFYNLVIFVMNELNECGTNYLHSNKEYCKYYALFFFEQSNNFYKKYLSKKEHYLRTDQLEILKKQKKLCLDYINDINSGAIVLINESLNKEELFCGQKIRGSFWINQKKLGIFEKESFINKKKRIRLILREYEKLLSSTQVSREETQKLEIYINKIVKFNNILNNTNSKIINNLIEISQNLELKLDDDILIKENQKEKNENIIFDEVKKENLEIFRELDDQFNEHYGEIKFIKFILNKHPYPNFESDIGKINFNIYSKELITFLIGKYNPNNYTFEKQNYMKICLCNEISNKLNKLLSGFSIEESENSNSISSEKESELEILSNELSEEEIQILENYIKNTFKANNNYFSFDCKKDFIEKSIIASSILKKYIMNEKEKNSDNYIDINQPLNDFDNIYKNLNQFNDGEFWLSLFSKCLDNKGIEIVLAKKNDEKFKNIELAFFHSLISLGNYNKYELHFDFGKYVNKKILTDPTEKENFLKQWKIEIANKLNIDENKFIFTDLHYGSIAVYVVFLDKTIEEEKQILAELKKIDVIIKIYEKPIIEVIQISPEILDKKGNRYKGWGINEIRGGEKYLAPIKDWFGIGLKVRDKFDNGDNSWLGYKNKEGEYSIAYIGINNLYNNNDNNKVQILEDIGTLIKSTDCLKTKLYVNDINIKKKIENNQIITEKEEKCGDGVCVFQNPDYAENGSGYIDVPGYQIKIMLMCRVNPIHIRQPKSFTECWIVNPGEIRPYRILIKKIPTSALTENINCLKLLLKPDKNFIEIINSKDYSFFKIYKDERFKKIIKSQKTKVGKDDLFVMRLYTSFYFKFINNYIRDNTILETVTKKTKSGDTRIFKGFNENELKSWIQCLHLALSRNKNVEENTVAYRGVKVKFPSNVGVGTKFYLKEFLSTSTKKEFTEQWINNEGTIMIIIIRNNGTNGHPNYCYYLEDITVSENQYEILISCHCYFTITKIERGEKIDYISLICEGYLFD